MVDTTPYETTRFAELLSEQIRHEFTAHQQYVALAAWFDSNDLPRLAAHFYQQAVEERTHAMMMVRYLLDRDVAVQIPGVDEVRNNFDKPRDLIELALLQEQQVTEQIEQLFRVAREDDDVIAEQFVMWFLREQVEEVAAMRTLLAVVERAGDDVSQLFQIEDFIAREVIGDGGRVDPSAPAVAGG